MGRKKTLFIGFILILISLFPITILPKQASLFMVFVQFFVNINNLLVTYGSEVYPTRFRDIGQGWLNMFSFLGSAVAQYLVIIFFKMGWRVPYYFMIGVMILCCVVICFSPVETYGRPLDIKIGEDFDIDIQNKNKNEEKTI
jgi:MFS family permease